MARSLMIQGAGSNVGKSVIVAGLCRALSQRGYRVCPFKPQNMSNNAAAVADGSEIGRAQQLQAQACGITPTADMNPVLLKPETDIGAQVVVHGKRFTTVNARGYAKLRPQLMAAVLESFGRVCAVADIVLVEGAGSPAETNLRKGDIANMGFASEAGVPVLLVGDIERGGVIAQLVGTKSVLDRADAELVRGFAVNKFRGDLTLFDDGIRTIEDMTGWRSFGTIPWFDRARLLPSEDAQDLMKIAPHRGIMKVVCLALSRIANFDDLDPLRLEPELSVEMLPPGCALPGDAGLVIVPGSKSTRGDLAFLRRQGWDVDIFAHVRRGGRVLGICGGYQMLGRTIRDPDGLEGTAGDDRGLGLLNVETTMLPEKRVRQVSARASRQGPEFQAYEIHIGRTCGPDTRRPYAFVDENGRLRPDGAVSGDRLIAGTYLHGLFADDGFRREWLAQQSVRAGGRSHRAEIESTLDALADHLERHIDIEALIRQMRSMA